MKKINRFLAKHRLLRRYKYLAEVEKITEEYTTERILDGGSADFIAKSRNDLLQAQSKIVEYEKMISFLKKLKV